MMNKEPLVSIFCITYNHASYISQCIEGFLNQKTSFPFEIIINDDCSTDGTVDILKEYYKKAPNIIRLVLHDENCYSKGIKQIMLNYIYPIAKGKYYALCEGDDYWTDPNKLQMQVDFLESHPEYSMCFHDVDVKVEEGRDMSEKDKFAFLREKEYTRQDQLEMMRIVPTCSIVIRQDVFSKYPHNPKLTIGDVVVVATALTYGRIWCMANKMGVYRLVPNGWTALSDEKVCRSMFSHYQGMIESFSWYQCKRGYETFRFWAFSLLMILKEKNGCEEEFTKYAEEYKKFTKEKTLWRFWLYYFNRKIRAFLRSLLGEKFVSHFR